ncbi:diguanylate cyclase [Thalassomonas viridans]|uniref:diguanylate cyclase n=1 Tax=Thalassomonas viridans TaxID=137584 RepID=A0AAE9Z2Q1_9GAMM|nr:diguanylate cyclase [Thalassomonas viridans]WDE05478.1 diguanylate cyclase [Thalassomonas viridans]
MFTRFFWLCLACALFPVFAAAANDDGRERSAPNFGEYHFWHGALADAPTEITAALEAKFTWQKASLENHVLPLSPGGNWLAFQLENQGEKPEIYYLTLVNSFAVNDAKLYLQHNSSAPVPVALTLSADHKRSATLALPPQGETSLYLFIGSEDEVTLPFMLVAEQESRQARQETFFTQGLALGGIAALVCALLLVFVAGGNRQSLFLSGYFLCQLLLLSVLQGRNLAYYFPGMPVFIGLELPLLSLLSAILLILFCQSLFVFKEDEQVFSKVLKWLVICMSICLLPTVIFTGPVNLVITLVLSLLVSLLLLALALYLRQKNYRHATLFALVVAVPLVCNLFSFAGLGDYSRGLLSGNAALYTGAAGLQAALIVFLFGRQFHYKQQDIRASQQEALARARTSEQAREELLALQEENQEQLEIRVQERTLELNIALQELESANRELAKKNTIDELSGLFNRRHYDKKILAEYRRSKRNLTPLSIVLIDIDHFKKVNDNYGHLAGDQCIVWVANHIKQSLKRSADIGCRYGGEEFCLILPDTEPLGAYALAETLRLAIAERPMVFENKEIPLTVSCGISTYRQQADVLPEQIFAAADKALYNAKDGGRNQVQQQVYIDPLISESSHE